MNYKIVLSDGKIILLCQNIETNKIFLLHKH